MDPSGYVSDGSSFYSNLKDSQPNGILTVLTAYLIEVDQHQAYPATNHGHNHLGSACLWDIKEFCGGYKSKTAQDVIHIFPAKDNL